MVLLIKSVLKALPFVWLLVVMWYVSYFRLDMWPMIFASTLGVVVFMALAILADTYEMRQLRKTDKTKTNDMMMNITQ